MLKAILYSMFLFLTLSISTFARGTIYFDGVNWTDYTHGNVTVTGKSIEFEGYPDHGYNDFLYYEGQGVQDSRIQFTLDQSKLNYHSMDGGGFLINTTITGTEPNEHINGFMLLFGEGKIDIYRVDMPVNEFYSSSSNSKDNGTLLQSFPIGSRNNITDVIIDIKGNLVTVYENGVKMIDNFDLGIKPGSGYGPVAAFASHACSRISYFGYSNIVSSVIAITSDHYILGDNTNPNVVMMISCQNLRLKVIINGKVVYNQITTLSGEFPFQLNASKYSEYITIEAQLSNSQGDILGRSSLEFNKRNILNDAYILMKGPKGTGKVVFIKDIERYYENNEANRKLVADIKELRRTNNAGIFFLTESLSPVLQPLLEN